jgi:hypothetical protein
MAANDAEVEGEGGIKRAGRRREGGSHSEREQEGSWMKRERGKIGGGNRSKEDYGEQHRRHRQEGYRVHHNIYIYLNICAQRKSYLYVSIRPVTTTTME